MRTQLRGYSSVLRGNMTEERHSSIMFRRSMIAVQNDSTAENKLHGVKRERLSAAAVVVDITQCQITACCLRVIYPADRPARSSQ